MRERSEVLLVVDDEEPNRDLLSRRLRKAGYQVECAGSAREALEVIERETVDLVLLDNMMPEMTGIDLLKLLRATQSAMDLPVIMVTALSDSGRVVEALTSGANDYVTKPIDFPVALARVEAQLQRLREQRKVKANEERLALAAKGANEGLFDWNLVTDELYVNDQWKKITGWPGWAGKTGQEWLAGMPSREAERWRRNFARWSSKAGAERVEDELRLLGEDGSCRWIVLKGTLERSAEGRPQRLVGSIVDTTLSKAYDALTALANQHMLLHWMEQIEPGAVLMLIGLDRYKIVQESFGVASGEKLLEEIAVRLETTLSEIDPEGCQQPPQLAKLEGDQFGVLVGPDRGAKLAEALAQILVAVIEKPLEIQGRRLFTSANVGMAIANGQTPEQLLQDAGTALGQARLLGRGQVAYFEEGLRGRVIDELELETDLRIALEQGQLEVYYQPKLHLQSHRVSGFEALLRWKHPVRGWIPPDVFIPIAEQSGLIQPIGEWVLREACQTMQRWRKEFPERAELEVSVNVSAYQMRDGRLAERVRQVLQETGLPAHALQLEITESVFIADTRETQKAFDALREMGVNLNLDDFGTGYSSLQYLRNLRFDALKIDKSFLRNMTLDDASSELVRSMMGIAHSLDMNVVAEGVETEEQLNHLREMGCQYGQGYLFSKPVPAEEALAILRGEALPG
jgi:EAL domain-containing protein (putative c-di-GMP-specific phosphodiesterase class I)/PleD family two-component response regulator